MVLQMSELSDEKARKPPVMNRSRGQLASAYAPGAFFTFEGGLGACMALPDPHSEYDPARISEAAKRQIVVRLAEIGRSWFDRAFNCRPPEAKYKVVPRMCLDNAWLDSAGQVAPFGRDVIDFVNPIKVSYAPAPLTFVCNTCGLFRSFESVQHLERVLPKFSPATCQNPKTKCVCQWRQLDVIFVHWSGNWEPASPGRFDWDPVKREVRRPIRRCAQCHSEDYLLNTSSPMIGQWFFQCAMCGHKEGETWLQNDPETIRMLQESFGDRITDVRMEPISYRASAAFYPQSEQFIAFEEGEQSFLTILEASRRQDLEDFLARRYGFGSGRPADEEIKDLLRQAGMYESEWLRYEGKLKQAANARQLATASVDKTASDMLRSMADSFEADASTIFSSWFTGDRPLLRSMNDLSEEVKSRLNERPLMVARYDPFVLSVEHEALRRNKLNVGEGNSGRRAFVRFTALDSDLAPRDATQKTQLEARTKDMLDLLGIDEMGLIREFDLCRFTYGYTRVNATPDLDKRNTKMPVRLNLFPSLPNGRKPIYAVTQANEAFYVRLKADDVYRWLRAIEPTDLFEWHSGMEKRIGAFILERSVRFERFLANLRKAEPAKTYLYVYTLLHTYAHILMKEIAEHSGLDVSSLGEYIFPVDLAFVVYRNGTTMDLGNLSSLWRNDNVHFLERVLAPRTLLCSSGSLCGQEGGGACPDCIMIPETSCIAQNQLLSRAVLGGGSAPREDGTHKHDRIAGYLELVNRKPITKDVEGTPV
jgi:hypothetical protein